MKLLDKNQYVEGLKEGRRNILAKSITLIESSLASHQEVGRAVIDEIMSRTGRAVRIGVTGIPGAGKSTFIESFGMTLIKEGHNVAVLAVDPSSSRSGGSILADKTRMERLATQEKAFIRPSPTGGTLGGVAMKTREAMLLCEAAGYDVIIIETVGVGQSEITVASMVDFFLVLMIPGAGDEIQGIKKGILELADAVVINKADGDNMERAERARTEFENALHLLSRSSNVWDPPVLTCSGLEMTGIDAIWEMIREHREALEKSGELQEKRQTQAVEWMWSLIEERLKERFYNKPEVKEALSGMVMKVKKGEMDPTAAAARLLGIIDE